MPIPYILLSTYILTSTRSQQIHTPVATIDDDLMRIAVLDLSATTVIYARVAACAGGSPISITNNRRETSWRQVNFAMTAQRAGGRRRACVPHGITYHFELHRGYPSNAGRGQLQIESSLGELLAISNRAERNEKTRNAITTADSAHACVRACLPWIDCGISVVVQAEGWIRVGPDIADLPGWTSDLERIATHEP